MKLKKWWDDLRTYEHRVQLAQELLDKATHERDSFMRETIGFAPRDMATVSGTVDLVSKVIDMKLEEKSAE